MRIGIESINAYVCGAVLDVRDIFQHRALNMQRFGNLMIEQKSVHLPFEDPVTAAVNAAQPLVSSLSEDERRRIEMVVTATESGIDFGKSISTYVHSYLGLGRNCRLFEVKQACFAGTAALTTAANFVAANPVNDPKVLVIATDVARTADEMTYAEPTQGAGAVAFLVSGNPDVLELDFGASGYYGYEVMDTCRPSYDVEAGDPDLSLYSYLDCLEHCFEAYANKVESVDVLTTFGFLVFHTPFVGMVKGAHRKLLRQLKRLNPTQVEEHFQRCMQPGLVYAARVGNLYSASLYLALLSLLNVAVFEEATRVGLFSYGSGCSSEFFSGVVGPESKRRAARFSLDEQLDRRCRLSWRDYLEVLRANRASASGVRDLEVDVLPFAAQYEHFFAGRRLLVLERIKAYHREYRWS